MNFSIILKKFIRLCLIKMLDFTPYSFSSSPQLSSKNKIKKLPYYCFKYFYWRLINKKGFRKAYCIMKSTTSHLKKNSQKLIKVLASPPIISYKFRPIKGCRSYYVTRMHIEQGMPGKNGAVRSITLGNEVGAPPPNNLP